MAKTGAFTDGFGNSYTASFWVCDQINVSTVNRRLVLIWLGWKDKASHDAGLASVASHVITKTGTDFDNAIGPIYSTVKTQAYYLTDGTSDTLVNGVLQPFFTGFITS